MIVRLAAAGALLLFQLAAADLPAPNPRYFRYQRSLSVSRSEQGQACAVLDANVLAHATKESLDDLRLYDASGREVPYIITESGSSRASDEAATLHNLGARNGDIVFDLVMPNRPYTAVDLNLDANDFLATAHVTGSNAKEGPVDLGSFALFDLTSQHLSRSTTLPLQESTFHELHVTLHMTASPGVAIQGFAPSIVKGATVPPSREAQTLYTTVASATSITQRGRETVARVHIPAHMPVERFGFTLDSAFTKEFLRTIVISATPDNTHDPASVETVTGEISHTTLPPGSTGFVSADKLTNLNVDAVLGADLREGATVEIAVQNGDDPPLPVSSVKLQMRERRICFGPGTASAYTLRYGDDVLKPPVYDYTRLFVASPSAEIAQLGPEEKNPSFKPRQDTRPYTERHPELLWVALIAVVAALGSVAMRSAKKRY